MSDNELPDLSKPAPLGGAAVTQPHPTQQPSAPSAAVEPASSNVVGTTVGRVIKGAVLAVSIAVLIGVGYVAWNEAAMVQSAQFGQYSSENAAKSSKFIDQIMSSNQTGFQSWTRVEGNYGVVGCFEEDQCAMADSLESGEMNEATFCKQLIDYAVSMGATEWDSFRSQTRLAVDDKTNAACIEIMRFRPRFTPQSYYSGEFLLHGTSSAGIPFVVSGTAAQRSPVYYMGTGQEAMQPSPLPHGSGVLAAERVGFSITVATEFVKVEPPQDPNNLVAKAAQAADLLNAMIYYRPSNKDLDVNSKKFVDAVIADWNRRYNYGAKASAYVDSKGKVYWFEIHTKDGFDACVSTFPELAPGATPLPTDVSIDTGQPADVGTFDGMPASMHQLTSMNETHGFGDYVVGSCQGASS